MSRADRQLRGLSDVVAVRRLQHRAAELETAQAVARAAQALRQCDEQAERLAADAEAWSTALRAPKPDVQAVRAWAQAIDAGEQALGRLVEARDHEDEQLQAQRVTLGQARARVDIADALRAGALRQIERKRAETALADLVDRRAGLRRA